MEHRKILAVLSASSLGLAAAQASDPPASRLNPRTGHVETVDTVRDGDHDEVRHTVDDGSSKPESELITSSTDDDRHPRIAISSSGDAWVVWYRDSTIRLVLARKHSHDTGTWSSERLLSDATEPSSFPVVAHDGIRAWVAFEIDDGADTGIAVNAIVDEPDPLSLRTLIATTSHGPDRDLQLHHDAGNLWVSWIDSTTEIGWSEFDHVLGEWSAVERESYVADTVDEARTRIRNAVLAN
jgi:hypothetical protein